MAKNSESLVCSLTISVKLDEKIARYVVKAIEIEVADGEETDARTKITMEYKNNYLHFTIYASDLSSLRASLNSYVRWLNLAIESAQLSNNQFPSIEEEEKSDSHN